MSNEKDDADAGWQSGVTVKRTTYGYCWTISIPADGTDDEELRRMVERTKFVDRLLREHYDTVLEPADVRRKAKP